LTDGRYEEVRASMSSDGQCLQVRRGGVVLACNIGAEPATLCIQDHLQLLLASDAGISQTTSELRLPPDSVAVLAAGPDARHG
jgi:hypothetical protein